MPVFKFQTRKTTLPEKIPKRIISLVPSQTELLYDLGLRSEVVGITKFCVHPNEWFRNKPRVGGTKQLNMDAIHALQPDLIIANKEENVKEQIEELENHFPVWISDIEDLDDAYQMISTIGIIVGKEEKAKEISSIIKQEFSSPLSTAANRQEGLLLPTIYLIWQKPYMTIGKDTFIHAMMEKAGFDNCYANAKRYPVTTLEEIKNKNPQLIILSSEPFPFNQKHINEMQLHLPNTKIILADGEMFSWYGSRLQQAPAYFKKLFKSIY